MSKIISVPKNKDAEIALDYNQATEDQLIEISLSDEEFSELWNEGIFSLINDIAGTNIDDFEDDNIIDKEKIKKIIDKLSYIQKSGLLKNKLGQIITLFEEAFIRGTGVYFYF